MRATEENSEVGLFLLKKHFSTAFYKTYIQYLW